MANIAKQKGFTLAEVMIVVAIIGILSAIAVPSFLTWVPNIRLKAAARNLYSNMQKVKTEAIKRNENVVLLITAVDCTGGIPSPSGGYRIFVDDGSGGGIAKDQAQNGTELTLSTTTMPAKSALCGSTFGGAWTGFTPKGLPVGNNLGTITLKNDKGRDYTLALTSAGGIRLQ